MAGIQIDGVNNKIDFDDDLDTSISANTDDTLQVEVGGASIATMTASTVVFNEASADVDFRIEGNGDANAFFLDGEVDRIYLGHNADTNINGLNARLQISGTDFDKSSASLIRYSADANPPSIGFAKSRNASIAGNTIVQDGDFLGRIRFAGADGGDFGNVAAQIDCQVDGTPGVNDMPGRLSFSTAADGGTGATERVRIHQGGVMSASQGIALGVGTANTASNVLDDYEEGTWTPTIKSNANTIGRASGNENFTYTKIGRQVTVHFSLQAVTLSGTINNAGDFTRILGLPFTTSTTAGQRYVSTQLLYYSSGSKFEEENITCNVGTNSNYIEVLEHDGAGTGYSSARLASVTSGTYWMFQMTYFV